MENIQGMLEEIRGVVQNHFQDENKKLTSFDLVQAKTETY